MGLNRSDILHRLVTRFGYTTYLEIGTGGGGTFRKLPLEQKVGVDPKLRRWSLFESRVKKTTSNRFFARNRQRFDLIFIDGLHVASQVYQDIYNSLAVLREGGTIVVHDCLPKSEAQQRVPRSQSSWTGDVWRAILKAGQDQELTTFVFDVDKGCGVVRRSGAADTPRLPTEMDPLSDEISWQSFCENRHRWLRIYPPEEIYPVLDALPD